MTSWYLRGRGMALFYPGEGPKPHSPGPNPTVMMKPRRNTQGNAFNPRPRAIIPLRRRNRAGSGEVDSVKATKERTVPGGDPIHSTRPAIPSGKRVVIR